MAFTYANAKQFLADYDKASAGARSIRQYLRIANDANRALHSVGKWDFDVRTLKRSFAAIYNTGTVSVSAAGTTVTGSGTTFTSAMVNRFIRFNGEAHLYRITAFSGATSISCEAYQGASALSGVGYEIIDCMEPLPVTLTAPFYRNIENVFVGQPGTLDCCYELMPQSRAEGLAASMACKQTGVPAYYSVENLSPATGLSATTGNVPLPHLFVYPAPYQATVATIKYRTWPAEITGDTDDFSIPSEIESILREYLLAYLFREQRDPNFVTQMQLAEKLALEAVGNSRDVDRSNTRKMWTPYGPDAGSRCYHPQLHPDVLAQL